MIDMVQAKALCGHDTEAIPGRPVDRLCYACQGGIESPDISRAITARLREQRDTIARLEVDVAWLRHEKAEVERENAELRREKRELQEHLKAEWMQDGGL